jgi:hypothetical protein
MDDSQVLPSRQHGGLSTVRVPVTRVGTQERLAATSDAGTLSKLLDYQHGVITRTQALASGLNHDLIHRRTQPGGRWQRLLPGVYLTVTGTPTIDQRETAALLYAGPGGTLTGASAMRRHGLRGMTSQVVDVLVPSSRRRQSAEYVVVHRTWRLPSLVCYDGPVQFAMAARAVADAVRGFDDLARVRAVVAAAVQTRLCTIGQLASELESGPMRESALFRFVLGEVTQGVRSGPETDLMDLIKRGRLPMPLFNPRLLYGDEFIASPDAWWPQAGVAAEADSREWHLSPEGWEQTMRRHVRMTALGILVLHFTPRQIKEEPQEVLSAIRAALEARRGQPGPRVRTVPATDA